MKSNVSDTEDENTYVIDEEETVGKKSRETFRSSNGKQSTRNEKMISRSTRSSNRGVEKDENRTPSSSTMNSSIKESISENGMSERRTTGSQMTSHNSSTVPTFVNESSEGGSNSTWTQNVGSVSPSIIPGSDSPLSTAQGSRTTIEESVDLRPSELSMTSTNIGSSSDDGTKQSRTTFISEQPRNLERKISKATDFSLSRVYGYDKLIPKGFALKTFSDQKKFLNKDGKKHKKKNLDSFDLNNSKEEQTFSKQPELGGRESQSVSTTSRFSTPSTSRFSTGSTSRFSTGSNSRFSAGSTSRFSTPSTSRLNTGSASRISTGSTSRFSTGSNYLTSNKMQTGFLDASQRPTRYYGSKNMKNSNLDKNMIPNRDNYSTLSDSESSTQEFGVRTTDSKHKMNQRTDSMSKEFDYHNIDQESIVPTVDIPRSTHGSNISLEQDVDRRRSDVSMTTSKPRSISTRKNKKGKSTYSHGKRYDPDLVPPFFDVTSTKRSELTQSTDWKSNDPSILHDNGMYRSNRGSDINLGYNVDSQPWDSKTIRPNIHQSTLSKAKDQEKKRYSHGKSYDPTLVPPFFEVSSQKSSISTSNRGKSLRSMVPSIIPVSSMTRSARGSRNDLGQDIDWKPSEASMIPTENELIPKDDISQRKNTSSHGQSEDPNRVLKFRRHSSIKDNHSTLEQDQDWRSINPSMIPDGGSNISVQQNVDWRPSDGSMIPTEDEIPPEHHKRQRKSNTSRGKSEDRNSVPKFRRHQSIKDSHSTSEQDQDWRSVDPSIIPDGSMLRSARGSNISVQQNVDLRPSDVSMIHTENQFISEDQGKSSSSRGKSENSKAVLKFQKFSSEKGSRSTLEQDQDWRSVDPSIIPNGGMLRSTRGSNISVKQNVDWRPSDGSMIPTEKEFTPEHDKRQPRNTYIRGQSEDPKAVVKFQRFSSVKGSHSNLEQDQDWRSINPSMIPDGGSNISVQQNVDWRPSDGSMIPREDEFTPEHHKRQRKSNTSRGQSEDPKAVLKFQRFSSEKGSHSTLEQDQDWRSINPSIIPDDGSNISEQNVDWRPSDGSMIPTEDEIPPEHHKTQRKSTSSRRKSKDPNNVSKSKKHSSKKDSHSTSEQDQDWRSVDPSIIPDGGMFKSTGGSNIPDWRLTDASMIPTIDLKSEEREQDKFRNRSSKNGSVSTFQQNQDWRSIDPSIIPDGGMLKSTGDSNIPDWRLTDASMIPTIDLKSEEREKDKFRNRSSKNGSVSTFQQNQDWRSIDPSILPDGGIFKSTRGSNVTLRDNAEWRSSDGSFIPPITDSNSSKNIPKFSDKKTLSLKERKDVSVLMRRSSLAYAGKIAQKSKTESILPESVTHNRRLLGFTQKSNESDKDTKELSDEEAAKSKRSSFRKSNVSEMNPMFIQHSGKNYDINSGNIIDESSLSEYRRISIDQSQEDLTEHTFNKSLMNSEDNSSVNKKVLMLSRDDSSYTDTETLKNNEIKEKPKTLKKLHISQQINQVSTTDDSSSFTSGNKRKKKSSKLSHETMAAEKVEAVYKTDKLKYDHLLHLVESDIEKEIQQGYNCEKVEECMKSTSQWNRMEYVEYPTKFVRIPEEKFQKMLRAKAYGYRAGGQTPLKWGDFCKCFPYCPAIDSSFSMTIRRSVDNFILVMMSFLFILCFMEMMIHANNHSNTFRSLVSSWLVYRYDTVLIFHSTIIFSIIVGSAYFIDKIEREYRINGKFNIMGVMGLTELFIILVFTCVLFKLDNVIGTLGREIAKHDFNKPKKLFNKESTETFHRQPLYRLFKSTGSDAITVLSDLWTSNANGLYKNAKKQLWDDFHTKMLPSLLSRWNVYLTLYIVRWVFTFPIFLVALSDIYMAKEQYDFEEDSTPTNEEKKSIKTQRKVSDV
ncbi:hypothetical protein SNEBB_007347 [Seison nebaliae]|nr:hypothetical protein SNEBB_007347 [Seison nebaliae]